jgi:aminopeptidase N
MRVLAWLVCLLVVGCAAGGSKSPTDAPDPIVSASADDVHSHARPTEVKVRHLGLRLAVDFDAQRLAGTATLLLDRIAADRPLVLDTRDLEITAVQTTRATVPDPLRGIAELEGVQWRDAAWELGATDPILGAALIVQLPEHANVVRVAYRTAPEATGLQWLEPAQTADRAHPFLYSQSQAIHARSWIPCQDSPGVRTTYDAVIEVAPPLRALMAAEAVAAPKDGVHRFRMPQAIPSYLIALAAGAVEFRALGPRTGVWAEPSVLPVAASEFRDVERMLETTESLYGPYRWDRYDILVLPPAFPFGGMENPRLTFATPTILAGDRSLVALIAHELAHSWSGNLVTNATWADLWLNEGFTVYIERRIVEALYGRERAQMEALLGQQLLEDTLEELGDADERLLPDLEGRDPDEALSDIAYEKGASFLVALERSYGREHFDPFLQRWFSEHAFSSVTTAEFERFVERHLIRAAQPLPGRKVPDLQAWIHGPGAGPQAPELDATVFAEVDAALAKFVAGTLEGAELPVAEWTPHHWLHFLHAIPSDLHRDRLAELDRAHGLTGSGNAEILALWLEVGVRHGHRQVDDALRRFLVGVGRRKFLLPLYEALLAADRRGEALEIYAVARPGYHPITQHSLDALLGPRR